MGAMVDAVFLDCQKAFDRADRFLLINALAKLGVSPVLLNLLSDYLRGRSQITVVDGSNSEPLPATSGVPQGSVLGPILYICLVDTAAASHSPRTSLRMFADDLTAFRIIHTPDDEAEFQTDLDSIFDWAHDTKLTFNATKSVFVRFSDKRSVPEPPKYRLGPDPLPRSDSVKYLGIHLDHRLNWKKHVSAIAVKVKKRVRYISALYNRKCQRARIVLYNSLVLPLLACCSVVCSPRQKVLIDDLEHRQRKFLQTTNLGPALEDSTIERYCSRLHQLGMEPLILKSRSR